MNSEEQISKLAEHLASFGIKRSEGETPVDAALRVIGMTARQLSEEIANDVPPWTALVLFGKKLVEIIPPSGVSEDAVKEWVEKSCGNETIHTVLLPKGWSYRVVRRRHGKRHHHGHKRRIRREKTDPSKPLPDWDEVCKHCKHWRPNSYGAAYGMCRKNAPRAADANGFATWPETDADDSCGDFS